MAWSQYVGRDTEENDDEMRREVDMSVTPPGPIDNSSLQGSRDLLLSKAVIEKRDFIWIHEDLWDQLEQWYGGEPSFPRDVIAVGARVSYVS